MSDKIKKKKREDIQFLFPKNEAFVEGNTKKLDHIEDVKHLIAYRYGKALSPHRDREPEFDGYSALGFLGVSVIGCVFVISIEHLSGTIGFVLVLLSGLLLPFFLALIVRHVFHNVRGIYDDDKYGFREVNKLYKELIKSGRLLVGHVEKVEISDDNVTDPKTKRQKRKWTVDYVVTIQKKTQVKGKIGFLAVNTPNRLLPDHPIYILYVNKKLHVPL